MMDEDWEETSDIEVSSTEDEISNEEDSEIDTNSESNESNDENDDDDDDDDDDNDDDDDDDEQNDDEEVITRRVKLLRKRLEKKSKSSKSDSKIDSKDELKKKIRLPNKTTMAKKNATIDKQEENNTVMTNQIQMSSEEQQIFFANWICDTKVETKNIDFEEWQKNHSLREAYFFGPDNVSLLIQIIL